MTSSHAKLFLIDGTAYIHRAYHAIRSLSNSKGLPTNAVFGFTRMLMKLIEDRSPEYAAMFFDAKGPTFRHDIYRAYKANRPPMPEDMVVQLPYIRRITEAFGLPIYEMPGYEADDLIGTMSRLAEQAGFEVVMVTGDKDFVQLVTENSSIYDPMKDVTTDIESVRDRFGLEPHQMVEVMGLSGDAVDNVPGVPGIGPKTALTLIKAHGSLENLYEQLDTITAKKQKENLAEYRNQAFLSRRLVAIETRAPVEVDFGALALSGPDRQALTELFGALEFRQLQQALSGKSDLSRKDYQPVLAMAQLEDLVERLQKASAFALDTETTSTNPMKAELVGISVAMQPHQAFYIPCGHHYLGAPGQLKRQDVLDRLKPVLEDGTITKIGQNIKYDWMVLNRCGVDLAGVGFDTMVASYLLNPSKRAHNLDQIALDFLGHKTISYEEVAGKGKAALNFSQVPVEKAVPYACEDADVTLLAHKALAPKLAEIGLTELMNGVEMPLVEVLLRMELRGIAVDTDRLRELSKSFADQLDGLEDSIYALAGEPFNINSSQQLGHILFEKLKLPVQKKTKKRTRYSTDVNVLTTLAEMHELPAFVLHHRSLSKLKSTYADALIELVHPETGRIHTSYNQTVTATGRLSSSDPNLQNIPIRTDEGREIRRAFVPRQGWTLLSADYSQVELRLLAHCSGDEILIEAFNNSEDIHTRTASEVFHVHADSISPELRRQAKAINFGIIYGMSAYGLSRQLGISPKMAQTYIDHYFERYPGVKRFMDRTIDDARSTGATSTLLKRIRLLPDISSSNKMVRQAAERTAVNTPIQGSAADLIKVAMIEVDGLLRRKGFRSAMLLSVHDEIVLEVPPDEIKTVTGLVEDVMEGIWDLAVPLKVNVASGSNWAEAH
jgi:DNA polymerase-1